MKTAEEIAISYGLCTCDEAYTSRNMVAPDCPWHSMAVEEATEEYANEKVNEAVKVALQVAAEGAKIKQSDEFGLYWINKQSILSLEQEVLEKLNVKP